MIGIDLAGLRLVVGQLEIKSLEDLDRTCLALRLAGESVWPAVDAPADPRPKKARRGGRQWTTEQRQAQGDRMRARQAAKAGRG